MSPVSYTNTKMTSNNQVKYTLDKSENYYIWFKQIRTTVDEDLWIFFDPASDSQYLPPIPITVCKEEVCDNVLR